jgi:hypothetical protein
MNTPEHVTQVDVNENTEQYFDHSQTRLVHHHIRRVQGRDYGRILREYNTPAEWYKPPPTTRSIYYYDPIYQKYLQQQQHQATINHHVSIQILFICSISSYFSLFLHQFA